MLIKNPSNFFLKLFLADVHYITGMSIVYPSNVHSIPIPGDNLDKVKVRIVIEFWRNYCTLEFCIEVDTFKPSTLKINEKKSLNFFGGKKINET